MPTLLPDSLDGLNAILVAGGRYETTVIRAREQGIFYTPPPVARYLVEQSLGQVLNHHAAQLNEAIRIGDFPVARTILRTVRALRLCDPACGCGVFLLEALNRLMRFYRDVPECILKDISPEDTLLPGALDVARTQLFGVDRDAAAVALARQGLLRLALRLDCRPEETGPSWEGDWEAPFLENLKPGDALETDPAEFLWQRDFSGVGTFDVVVGNPPYLTEVRRHADLFRKLRTRSRVARYYTPKMDMADAFVYLGLDLLSDGGRLAFVLPEYWLHRASTQPLREYLWTSCRIEEIRTFGPALRFKTAPGIHGSLLIVKKQPPESPHPLPRTCRAGPCDATLFSGNANSAALEGQVFLDPGSRKFLLGEARIVDLLGALAERPKLLRPEEIQQGLVLPQDRLRPCDWTRLPAAIRRQVQPGDGIFLLTPDEVAALNLNDVEKALLKPYFSPRTFRPFAGFGPPAAPAGWVLYTDREGKAKLVQDPKTYARLRRHLDRFAPVLTSSHKPYGLHRARQPGWFEDPGKLLGLRQCLNPTFARVRYPAYVTEGFYILQPKQATVFLDVLAALLNSTLARFWFYHQKRKGSRLQVDKDVLLSFPKPDLLDVSWNESLVAVSIALRGRIAEKALERTFKQTLDQLVFESYGLSQHEQKRVTGFFKGFD